MRVVLVMLALKTVEAKLHRKLLYTGPVLQ